MINKKNSWWRWINWSLFFILFIEILIPSVYNLVRISLLSRVDNVESLYIGSLSQYTTMLYYVFKDALILSLYFYIGKNINKNNQHSLIKTILLMTTSIIFIFILGITFSLKPIVMNSSIPGNTNNINLTLSFLYINIWTVFLKLITFIIFIILIFSKKYKYLLWMIAIRFFSLLFFDLLLFVPGTTPFNFGVIGYASSDFISELILIVFGMFFIFKAYDLKIKTFLTVKLHNNKSDFYRPASLSFLESAIRSFGYTFVILAISLSLGVDGTIIWFITISIFWSFLLVPLYSLQEDVKKKMSSNMLAEFEHKTLWSYIVFSFYIFFVWVLFIPFIYLFISYGIEYNSDLENIKMIIFYSFLIMLPFQFMYMVMRIVDQTIYAKGETKLLLLRTIIMTVIFIIPVFIILQIDEGIIVGENNDFYLATSIYYAIFLSIEGVVTIFLYKYISNKYGWKKHN